MSKVRFIRSLANRIFQPWVTHERKGLPRGGYTELDLAQTNYLRELVELTPETSSKVAVEKDRRRMKANQIRRAVKRHSQTSANPRQGNNSNRRSSTRNKTNG